MRKWFLILALLVTAQSAFAFDVSPTQVKHAVTKTAISPVSTDFLQSLTEESRIVENAELVLIHPEGNRISSIRGVISEPLTGNLEASVRSFILSHPKLFNLPAKKAESAMKLISHMDSGKSEHFRYQMVMNGVPVLDSEISVHVGKDKKVHLTNGSFPTVQEITNQIAIGPRDAIAIGAKLLQSRSSRFPGKAELSILPENGNGRMVYETKIAASQPLGDWLLLIDAETGKELFRNNEMVFATGKGSLYVNHPMAGDLTIEDLLHLTSHNLRGLYANVDNEDTDEAFNEEDNHMYGTDNTHFDEVMIYFHVNKVHDLFKSLGFDKMDFSMKAIVHLGDNYDNAYFSPWQNVIAFGDGSRFNPLSREETVCYHEYSHATINKIVSLTYSNESGAMNEGQADYFACSMTNDPKLGEYVCAKMGKPYLRIMENDLVYPKDITGEVHADGRIWGAVLWDIRAALGAQISDMLIHKSFFYLKGGSPKFLDGANAIFTADDNFFGGANKEALMAVFQKRGITPKSGDEKALSRTELRQIKAFNTIYGN
jgi:Zn-dependent metalloprotease